MTNTNNQKHNLERLVYGDPYSIDHRIYGAGHPYGRQSGKSMLTRDLIAILMEQAKQEKLEKIMEENDNVVAMMITDAYNHTFDSHKIKEEKQKRNKEVIMPTYHGNGLDFLAEIAFGVPTRKKLPCGADATKHATEEVIQPMGVNIWDLETEKRNQMNKEITQLTDSDVLAFYCTEAERQQKGYKPMSKTAEFFNELANSTTHSTDQVSTSMWDTKETLVGDHELAKDAMIGTYMGKPKDTTFYIYGLPRPSINQHPSIKNEKIYEIGGDVADDMLSYTKATCQTKDNMVFYSQLSEEDKAVQTNATRALLKFILNGYVRITKGDKKGLQSFINVLAELETVYTMKSEKVDDELIYEFTTKPFHDDRFPRITSNYIKFN